MVVAGVGVSRWLWSKMMNKVIVCCLVATLLSGNMASSSGVNNKVRETGSGDRLLTWAEMMNGQVIHHHLVTMSLSETWHCVACACWLAGADDVALPHHACCVGVCCAPCGWWMVMAIHDGVGHSR